MNILTFDTATSLEIVTLNINDSYCNESKYVDESHSISLFDSIDKGLKKLNATLSDISLLAVGTGPGSFTGLRIAVSTARMLAQILKIPLVGVPTHLLYTASVSVENDSNTLITFDAKKNRVFGALYRKEKNCLFPKTVVEPGDYQIETLLDQVDLSYKTYCIGDGTNKYRDTIHKVIPDHFYFEHFQPEAEIITKLVQTIYNQDPNKYNDLNLVTPNYARKSDAEVLKARRNKTK